MASIVSPTTDERDNLLKYLAAQRDAFRQVAFGLTDDQARMQPTAGSLSIGGLIKHLAQMERNWVATVLGRPQPEADYVNGFTMLADETLADLLADLAACGEETERLLAGLSLDHPVAVPDAPWFPKDVEHWSLRWVLAHLIEEFARHAGHADIVRESIDGKTMYELQAMADGRHEQYVAMMARFSGESD
jgi:uncharacterized damage-inducible protein DinB